MTLVHQRLPEYKATHVNVGTAAFLIAQVVVQELFGGPACHGRLVKELLL